MNAYRHTYMQVLQINSKLNMHKQSFICCLANYANEQSTVILTF